MSNGSKKNSFLVQGSILAVASIVSRIIGLVYRVAVTNILGDIGNDYYSCAFSIYSIMLTISSYSLPLAVSKLVSARMARGQKRNAARILKGALIFSLISGAIVALVCFFGADFITTNIMNTPMSAIALRVLAPTLLIVAIMGVLRGYFQGLGSMIPTATSQIIEQIVNACGSIVFAITFSQYGLEIGQAMSDPENYMAAYGAAGSTLGTSVGALAGLVFLLIILFAYRPVLKRGIRRDKTDRRDIESYSNIYRVILLTTIPVLLSTTVYRLSEFLDQSIYKKMMAFMSKEAIEASINWGIYAGRVTVLIAIPTTIADSIAVSVIPSLTAALSEDNHQLIREKIISAIRFVMVISFPCAVGMGVLASPILQLLYHDTRALPAQLIIISAISIVFYTLSTLTTGILQGIDKMLSPVINAFVALVIHVIVIIGAMLLFDLNIYAVVISNIVFPFVVSLMNTFAIKKHIRYRANIRKTYVVPAISSIVMGIVVWTVYKFLMFVFYINALATLVSIIIGVVVYFIVLLALKGLSEDELLNLPKGHILLGVAKSFGFYK